MNIVAKVPYNVLLGLNFTEKFNQKGSDFIVMIAPDGSDGGDSKALPHVNAGYSDGN